MSYTLLIKLFILSCVVSLLPVTVAANCSTTDVQFYLEKGFTHEQVTRLCEPPVANAKACASGEGGSNLTAQQVDQLCSVRVSKKFNCASCSKQNKSNTAVIPARTQDSKHTIASSSVDERNTGQSDKQHDAIQALKTGGDVYNLNVSDTDLFYSEKTCVLSGNAIERGRRREYCHNVNYTISRANLQASVGKSLPFIGAPNALIASDMSIELGAGVDGYPFEIRKQFEAYLEGARKRDNVKFPIRKGIAVENMVQALQILSL